MTLTLDFKTLNLQIILSSERFNKALNFQKSIPCDETFPWVPTFFYPVTLSMEFDIILGHMS